MPPQTVVSTLYFVEKKTSTQYRRRINLVLQTMFQRRSVKVVPTWFYKRSIITNQPALFRINVDSMLSTLFRRRKVTSIQFAFSSISSTSNQRLWSFEVTSYFNVESTSVRFIRISQLRRMALIQRNQSVLFCVNFFDRCLMISVVYCNLNSLVFIQHYVFLSQSLSCYNTSFITIITR